jgi:PST family polysaccharide transporter
VPLLLIPYLVSVLGIDTYGLVVWAQTIILFFIVVIRFGFDISVTRKVSIHRGDLRALSELVSAVFIIKFIMLIISLVFLVLLVALIDKLKENEYLLYLSALIVFGELFSIPWFFQGIEKMKFITYAVSTSRCVSLILVFFFVKDEGDYLLVPLVSGVSVLISSLIYIYYAYMKYGLLLLVPSRKDIAKVFYESASFFMSRASAMFITKFNVVVLEGAVGLSAVAFYDISEKMISILRMPFSLYNQALYPNIAKSKDMEKVLYVIKRSFFLGLIAYFFLVILKQDVLSLVSDDELFLGYIEAINIFGVLIVLSSIDYFLGTTVLVVNGHVKEFNLSVLLAALAYLFLIAVFYLFDKLDVYTAILSVMAGECVQISYRFYHIKKASLFYGSSENK